MNRRLPIAAAAGLAAFSCAAHAQETPPAPAAPRSVAFATPVERTLPNGLRVIVVERPGTGLVSARLLVKTGGEGDPENRAGLADLTATLLKQGGTTTRTPTQIAERIEALGGSLDTGARWDASTASLDVLAANVRPAMELLADVVLHPAFKPSEIERVRRETLDELAVSLKSPGTLARLVAARALFRDSPYGHPLGGTLESVKAINRDDLARFHQRYYRPVDSVLVIGGDIKEDAAFALAQTLFSKWKAGLNPRLLVRGSGLGLRPAPALAPGGTHVLVVDKPDAGQAAVLVTAPGLARTDPDYFRALVANSVLGGGYSARLNQEIRIKRGLSYGAGSAFDARRAVGPFVASAQTKNESGAEVARILAAEVGRLASEPITDTELVPRKAVLTGGFARGLEATGGYVSQVANLALYGLPLSEINRYITQVQAVSAGDVQQFAGKRLGGAGLTVVIVGDAKKFRDDLSKNFPDAAVEVIPEAELDLNRPGLRRTPPR